MAGASAEGGTDNDADDAVDPWAWTALSLGRKISASLVGGVAAAGGVWAIDIWLFHGDDLSLARFVFTAALWAVMLPIVFWVNDRRR